MKKIILFVVIVSTVALIKTWGFWVPSIENPEIDKFEEYYVDDDFTVLIRSEINPETAYEMAAWGIGKPFGTQCSVGGYEKANYMVYYKEKYYDIWEFNKFFIISCEDLSEMNLPGLYD